jgi:hypothetical protein
MKFHIFAIYLILISLCTSCLVVDKNYTVLQKSLEPTPEWINQSGEKNSNNTEFVNLVYKKDDIYNLPLGLKQSQTIASKKINYLILDNLKTQIFEKIVNQNPNIKNTSAINIVIAQAFNNYFRDIKLGKNIAEQVYWEYRQTENARSINQYYTVWILLLIPKTVYDNAFLAIARDLQHSKDQATVTLGNDIENHFLKAQ